MVLYFAIAIVAIITYIFLFANSGKVKGLKDKYVLITGCDSGFGRRIMEQLDKKGVNVFACCLLQKSVDEIRQNTTHCIPFTMNVTDTEDVRKGVAFVKEKLPANRGLWGIVNNAGVIGCGYADWLTKKDYERVISVNLLGVIDVTIQFLGLVIKEKGRIVNVASMLGRHHQIFTSSYVAAKFGVIGFSDSLRIEMRPFGVSVHNLCPGYFQTPLNGSASDVVKDLAVRMDEETRSRYTEEHIKECKLVTLSEVQIYL